jgi:hypothetical protein
MTVPYVTIDELSYQLRPLLHKGSLSFFFDDILEECHIFAFLYIPGGHNGKFYTQILLSDFFVINYVEPFTYVFNGKVKAKLSL